MFTLIKIGDHYNSTNVREYMIDDDTDIEDMPTDCDPGSTASTADCTSIYRLNNHHEWKKVGGNS